MPYPLITRNISLFQNARNIRYQINIRKSNVKFDILHFLTWVTHKSRNNWYIYVLCTFIFSNIYINSYSIYCIFWTYLIIQKCNMLSLLHLKFITSIAWKKDKTKIPLGIFVLSNCQRISLLPQMDLYIRKDSSLKTAIINSLVF